MEYHQIVIVIALMVASWVVGRLKPFHFIQLKYRCFGIEETIERWYTRDRNNLWTCVGDNLEEDGGPFGFPARIITFENGYESISMSGNEAVFNKITPGTQVRLRMRTKSEFKSGRIGGMLDTFVIPEPIV